MSGSLRLVFLTAAAAGVLLPASAQITITAADVASRFAVGNSIATHQDTLTTSINVVGTGARSWDFSGLLSHTTTTLKSVNPASTPFIGQFPGATYALQAAGEIQGIAGTLYQYFTLSTNLLNLGSMASGSPPYDAITYKTTNTPPAIYYALPSTYGTNWSTTYTDSTTIDIPPFYHSVTVDVYSETYVVDAYGPMTMPGGAVYQALRLNGTEISGPDTTVFYFFLSKEGATVQVNVAGNSPQNDGVITAASVAWTGPLSTDVRIGDITPAEFALLQNYPNPFNPTTTITYQIPNTGIVSVKVYNMLGEEVATLVDGTRVPGTYSIRWDASNVPSGAYVVRMQSGEFSQSQRMMIVR